MRWLKHLQSVTGLQSGDCVRFLLKNTTRIQVGIRRQVKLKIKPKKLPFFKCGKELKERVDS